MTPHTRAVSSSPHFETALARLQLNSRTLFAVPDISIESRKEIVGPFTRVMQARVQTGGEPVDLFVKRYVPTNGTPEELARQRRYLNWELERLTLAHAAFQATPSLGVPSVVTSFPDLLVLVTRQAPGVGLDRVLKRLTLLRGSWPLVSAVEALRRAGQWVRRFQAGVPVRNSEHHVDYREYLDVRLRGLVRSAGGYFTQRHRDLVLALFDRHADRLRAEELRLVAVHSDLCPANVLVRNDGLNVLDFAMSSDGNMYADIAHLDLHLHWIGRRWRLPQAVIDRLERALLESFDPEFSVDAPLFRLMLLQHVVCHLALCAAPARGPLRVIHDRRLPYRIERGFAIAGARCA